MNEQNKQITRDYYRDLSGLGQNTALALGYDHNTVTTREGVPDPVKDAKKALKAAEKLAKAQRKAKRDHARQVAQSNKLYRQVKKRRKKAIKVSFETLVEIASNPRVSSAARVEAASKLANLPLSR